MSLEGRWACLWDDLGRRAGQLGHGLLGEIVPLCGDPFVVLLDADRRDETKGGGVVREDPDDSGAAPGSRR